MNKALKRIAVTGAAGQIGYSLVFRIANGELFGSEEPIALNLLEMPEALGALEGVRMELEDGAYPLLNEIKLTSDPLEAFKDVDCAILVGAKPRTPGMERGELLLENGKHFSNQGKALDAVAKDNVQVIVVGNPCNTNCLIAIKQLQRLSPLQFHAMTRLDENRAKALLARKSGEPVSLTKGVIIWGNHSATQVPDAFSAQIGNESAISKINDAAWFEGAFVSEIQKRGAAILNARGKSSAASAAQAILDHLHAVYRPTPKGEWFSMGIYSAGNTYGIDNDLVFSFPCRSEGNGQLSIVSNIPWNEFIRSKIQLTQKELLEERLLGCKEIESQMPLLHSQ